MHTYEIVANGLEFPEGPVVMADGSVIVVEMTGGRITRCWNGKKEVIREYDEGPNGAATGPDGALYVCNNGGHGHLINGGEPKTGSIDRIDLATGKADRLYASCNDEPLSSPNDLVFDSDGNLWFTDLGKVRKNGKSYGGLYCARPDGSSIVQIAGQTFSYNGIGISPDNRTVYVADTYQARVYAFERKIEPQQPRLVANVPGMVYLDSLAMTQSGNICVATFIDGAISVVTPEGHVTRKPFDDYYVTNIAFGGADMCDAWITFSQRGLLVKTRWEEPGLNLAFNA